MHGVSPEFVHIPAVSPTVTRVHLLVCVPRSVTYLAGEAVPVKSHGVRLWKVGKALSGVYLSPT